MSDGATSSAPEPEVVQVAERDRYEIRVGGEAAGFTQYLDQDGQRIFFHTEVDDAYSGRGLAGRLVGAALEATRQDGLRVVPVCPYVAKFVKQHTEFADVVDKVTPAALDAVRGRG